MRKQRARLVIVTLLVQLTFLVTILARETVENKKPNLVVIMTDEHNLRTISAYRDYYLSKFPKDVVDVWGDDIFVDTPHIDSLANEGAMFTNYYTTLPTCTPSRASFLTGLFPFSTGAVENDTPMSDNVKTWADHLQESSYQTAYFGKWHLDGVAKPGFYNDLFGSKKERSFGFQDNTYRYNRGHWKILKERHGKVDVYKSVKDANETDNLEESYTTDFFVNKAIEYIEDKAQTDNPFALFLSIADPHNPNEVRKPYSEKYKGMNFQMPRSTKRYLESDPSPPGFYGVRGKDYKAKNGIPIDTNIPFHQIVQHLNTYEQDINFKDSMQAYFGMVKLIDDKIGDLLATMNSLGIENNTVVVFTSDHGDLSFEHGRTQKGEPYLTSAGIPLIIKYPGVVPVKKRIDTAYSIVDFAPTILGLLNISATPGDFHGVDGSQEILNSEVISLDRSKPIIMYHNDGRWLSAVKGSFKLVVNNLNKSPTLFDLGKDPEELNNVISERRVQKQLDRLQNAIGRWVQEFNFTTTQDNKNSFNYYLDKIPCEDSPDVLHLNDVKGVSTRNFCKDQKSSICNFKIRRHCPSSCHDHCIDSPGRVIYGGQINNCRELHSNCEDDFIRKFCPGTCAVTTLNSASCYDDPLFKFPLVGGKKKKCVYIQKRKSKHKRKLCSNSSVAESCKRSCGRCAKNIQTINIVLEADGNLDLSR